MRQFSIHKVNKPMMRHKSGAAADGEDEEGPDASVKNGAGEYGSVASAAANGRQTSHIHGEHSSLLTAEELEALQPKEVKVVNPLIHDATHKEYLESVKVSLSLQIHRGFAARPSVFSSARCARRSYLNIIS